KWEVIVSLFIEMEFSKWKTYTRQRKSPEVISNIIGTARAFTYNPKLHDDLMLVFGALTQFHNKEYRAAYVYAWIMIEDFISSLWKEYITNLERSEDERKSFKT